MRNLLILLNSPQKQFEEKRNKEDRTVLIHKFIRIATGRVLKNNIDDAYGR